jgi:baculoviral IAP repeat-containing protein 6
MECLSVEFEAWTSSLPVERHNEIVLLDSETTADGVSLTMLLDREHEFSLMCPANYPSHSDNFFATSSSARLWCNALNEYLLDSPSPLRLHQVLNKALELHSSRESEAVDLLSADSDDMGSENEVDIGEELDDEDEDEGHMGMLSDDEAFTTEWELELARKKVNLFIVQLLY